MARKKDWLIAGLVLLLGRGRPQPPEHEQRLVPRPPPNPRAELAVLALLGLTSAAAIGFVVEYALDAQTQLLGLFLGFSLLFLASALIVAARTVVPTEELVHEYPPEEHLEEQDEVAQLVDEAGDGFTRRRMLRLGLLGAGGTLGLAALAPAVSFGPLFRVRELYQTPWRKGRRLVDEGNRPWRAADIEQGDFYTAFPAGADKEAQGSPIVLVRLPKDHLALPPELAGYDADGIVAYSKICTHAGCAIAMYRAPLFRPDEPGPALVCPCHYSTFDPSNGGEVLFGPAGRRLPMLPLQIDSSGYLRAKGNFDGPVGPSWWGIRNRKPTSS